jgi:hypothetical protein
MPLLLILFHEELVYRGVILPFPGSSVRASPGGENNSALGQGASVLGGEGREVDQGHTDYSQAGATSFAP